MLVEKNTISIEEGECFKAVNFWATKEFDGLELEPIGETKRRILDKRIVKRLGFPVVTKGEFIDIVLGSSILALCGDDRLNFMADKEEMFTVLKCSG